MLEVSIAVVILATGVLIVLKALSSATLVEKELKSHTKAVLLLKEKADDVFAMTYKFESIQLPLSGDFGERAEGFSWTAERADDPGLKGEWIRVRVLWPAAGKEKNSVKTRLLLKADTEKELALND